jgi:thiol-disulfide isomerase/thioredoxin
MEPLARKNMMSFSKPERLLPKALTSALVLGVCLFLLSASVPDVSAAAPKGKDLGESEGAVIVLGKKSWKEWKAETDWDSYSADGYKPLKAKTSRISRLVKARKATFIIFAGSWCKDSEAQLPMIMKLLNAAQVPPRSIELFGVDANLKEPSGTAQRYEVANSPTLIILKGQTELGRIVERPESAWEDNILAILSR